MNVELKASECLSFTHIVAGPTCETHRLSNLIDILLQPYTKHIKSYIKDTTDPTSTNPDTLLVSFDVVYLYTNIPHDLGTEAIKYWLRKFPQELPAMISVEVLLKGIKFIWTASSEFGTYRLCEQRMFRRACACAQSRQNLRCSLIQAVNQEEPSDRKPDPWPL